MTWRKWRSTQHQQFRIDWEASLLQWSQAIAQCHDNLAHEKRKEMQIPYANKNVQDQLNLVLSPLTL